MLVTVLSLAAIFIIIGAYVVYYFDIKNSKIIPNKYSWLIWSFAVSLETITYNFVSDDIVKSLCFYFSAIICFLITIKIWKYSSNEKPKWTEKISLVFCFLSLSIWIVFNSAWFAHLFLLLAIPIAFIPTYRSAFKNYQNENSHAWILWSISDLFVLGIILLRLDKFEELPYAIIEFICHFTVFVIITTQKIKLSKSYVISENHLGKAVYTLKNFKKGEIILKFEGDIIHQNKLPKNITGVNDHYLQINPKYYLGPSGKADDFVNHSCNPNAGLTFIDNKIYLKAIKNIAKEKEITWDYSTSIEQTNWEMKCACLSANCRKVIKEFSMLNKSLQDTYIDLNIVSPFIKAQIKTSESHFSKQQETFNIRSARGTFNPLKYFAFRNK